MKLHHILMIPLIVVLTFGCAKAADPNKPIDQIKTEVQTMNVNQLQGEARAYAAAVAGKKTELEKVQEKLKGISPTELFSEKAKQIKDELSSVSSDVKALTDRYNIYATQFQKLGGDIAKIQVS